jgi:hypothetical protein
LLIHEGGYADDTEAVSAKHKPCDLSVYQSQETSSWQEGLEPRSGFRFRTNNPGKSLQPNGEI